MKMNQKYVLRKLETRMLSYLPLNLLDKKFCPPSFGRKFYKLYKIITWILFENIELLQFQVARFANWL